MTFKTRLFVGAVAVALFTPVHAQESTAVPERSAVEFDKLTKSISLNSSEGILRTTDGCSIISDLTDRDAPKVRTITSSWSGACPYGLADGPGRLVASDGSATNYTLWMGRQTYYDITSNGGKNKFFGARPANGGGNVRFKDVNLELVPYNDGIGDRWNGSVSLTSDNDRSSELLIRTRLDCRQVVAQPAASWVQDTKASTENLKDALKDCRKIVEKSKPMRHLRIIQHKMTDAAGTVTQDRVYPCAFHEEETKEAALDNSYCINYWTALGAQIKPRVDARIASAKAEHESIIAQAQTTRRELPGRYQALVLAELEEERKRKEALAAAMAQELPNRHAAFLESAVGQTKMQSAMKAPAPFIPPVDTSKTGVIVIGKGNGALNLKFDNSSLELMSQAPVQEISNLPSEEKFNAAYDKLKKLGVTTVYIVDLNKAFIKNEFSKLSTTEIEVATSSQTIRNSYYDRLLADLQRAQQEEQEAAAQKGMNPGPSTQAIVQMGLQKGAATTENVINGLLGLTKANSLAKRYDRAVQRRQSIEQQLSSTDQTKTMTQSAKVKMATVNYTMNYEGRLAIFACSVSTGMCSEKEKLVQEQAEFIKPAVTAKLDPTAQTFISSNAYGDGAIAALGKKIDFGFTGTDIGNFMANTLQDIPLGALPAYAFYAKDDATEKFYTRQAGSAKHKAIEAELRLIGDDYRAKGLEYHDINDFIADAYQAKEDEIFEAKQLERKKNLQSLTQ